MAAVGYIPARLNGVTIPHLANIQVSGPRNVIQRSTSSGVDLSYGRLKPTATLTFTLQQQKQDYLSQVAAFDESPEPHNLGFDIGADSFLLVGGIVSNTQLQSDQDGTADAQLTVMFESLVQVA